MPLVYEAMGITLVSFKIGNEKCLEHLQFERLFKR